MGGVVPRSVSALPLLLLLLLQAERPRGAELTFELPDNAKQCFHEEVEQGVKFSLDYQVRPGASSLSRFQVFSGHLCAPGCSGWN